MFSDLFKDSTTAMTVVFIVAMSVFNVLFINAFNQSGRYQPGDFFRFPAEANLLQDGFIHSSQAVAYGATPVDVGVGSEAEEVGFIIVENAALLNTNNPLSNIVPTREGVFIYKVQKGDTVSRIAANFGISVNTVLWANDNLRPASLMPGQEIIILPVTGILHHVEEGETIEDIANKYDVSAQKILNANPGLVPAKISLMPTIIVPDTRPPQSSGLLAKLPDLFGYFAIPTTGWNWAKLHNYNAVDIANACGTAVYAAAEGLVVEASGDEWNGGYGRYVSIEHPNGTKTKYAHNDKNLVSVGDYVAKGDQIAVIGNTGLTHGPTGCHLHFEVRGAKNPFAK